jgi:hypothetical protein
MAIRCSHIDNGIECKWRTFPSFQCIWQRQGSDLRIDLLDVVAEFVDRFANRSFQADPSGKRDLPPGSIPTSRESDESRPSDAHQPLDLRMFSAILFSQFAGLIQ